MPRIKQYAEVYRNNDFRKVIKCQMAARDLHQKDLAAPLGVTPAQISNLIRDPEKMNIDKLRKLVEFLAIPPEAVLAFTGCRTK